MVLFGGVVVVVVDSGIFFSSQWGGGRNPFSHSTQHTGEQQDSNHCCCCCYYCSTTLGDTLSAMMGGNPRPAPVQVVAFFFLCENKLHTTPRRPYNEITQIIYWILFSPLHRLLPLCYVHFFLLIFGEYLSHSDSLDVLNFFLLSYLFFFTWFRRLFV